MIKPRCLRCSFCRKNEMEVMKLVAGPRRVYICDQCVDVAVRLMKDNKQRDKRRPVTEASRLRKLLSRARQLFGGGETRCVTSPDVSG